MLSLLFLLSTEHTLSQQLSVVFLLCFNCQQSIHFPNNFCCLYSLFLLSRFQSQIVKIVLLISNARAADTVVFGKARCSHSYRPLMFRHVRLLHWLVFHALLAKLSRCHAVVFRLRWRVCCLLTLSVGWQLADSLSHNTKTAIVSLNREAVVSNHEVITANRTVLFGVNAAGQTL